MDERIKGEYRKIYAELRSIMMIFCAGSLFVKFFFFGLDISACATEFMILIAAPVYMLVRQCVLGISPSAVMTKKKRRMKVLLGLGSGLIAFMAVYYLKHGALQTWAWQYILSFGTAFLFVHYIGFALSEFFSGRKSREYEE